jgi:ATP-binding cassette subfamily B multidrug efflux pump
MARLVGDVAVFRQFVSFGFANLLSSLLMIMLGFQHDELAELAPVALHRLTTTLPGGDGNALPSRGASCFSQLREAHADMSTAVQENITGVRTVKSFAREPHQVELFSNVSIR